MPRLLKTEQEHHCLAFERYYSMGSRRSYDAVAEEVGASPATVKLWGRSFNWLARVRERDLKQAGQIAEQSAGDHAHTVQRNLKIVRAAIIHLARDIAEGNLKQIGDMRNLVHLEEHLMGIDQTGNRTSEEGGAGSGVVIYLPDNGRGKYPPDPEPTTTPASGTRTQDSTAGQ